MKRIEANLYQDKFIEDLTHQEKLATAYENLCLQVVIEALADEPGYINTPDCQVWLNRAGVDDTELVQNALIATNGKINDKRYINERMDE